MGLGVGTRLGVLLRCGIPRKAEIVYESPVALPGGNAVMFSIGYNTGERRVAVLTLNSGKWKTLVTGANLAATRTSSKADARTSERVELR